MEVGNPSVKSTGSRVTEKSHTLIPRYADEASGAILELFLMKTLSEPRTEGTSPRLQGASLEPTADRRPTGAGQGCLASPLPLSVVPRVLASAVR